MSPTPTYLRDVTLPNGLRVVVDPMPHLPTLGVVLSWPFGTLGDPQGAQGASVVLHEWIQRGAAGRDARAQADAFDRYGAQRGGGVGRDLASLTAACLARDGADVIALLASSVLAPSLDSTEFDGARELALQEIDALDDAPAVRLAESALRARYSGPHGRSAYGERSHVERLDAETLRAEAAGRLVADGAVLAIAGGGEPDAWVDAAERAFGAWRGRARSAPPPDVRAPHRVHHHGSGAQTQIALIDGAVAPGAPGWTEQALAMSVLSGGMGARLSTEVRERRGLAYAVSSSVHVVAGDAYRLTYAGTTPERAAATIEVLSDELERWRDGIDADELGRARALLRSGLVLEAESSGGRASRAAYDVLRFGRPRGLDEVLDALGAVGLTDVDAFLAGRPPLDATVVTSGPPPRGAKAAA